MDGSKEYVEMPDEDNEAMEVEEREEPEQAGPPRRDAGRIGQHQDVPRQAGPPRRRAGGNYNGTLWHEASEEEWAVIEETEAICANFNSHVPVRQNRCAREEERRREEYCEKNAKKLERSGRRTERMAEARRGRRFRQQPRDEIRLMNNEVSFYPEMSIFNSAENRRRGVPTPRPAPRQVANDPLAISYITDYKAR